MGPRATDGSAILASSDAACHTPLDLTAAQRGMWFAERLSADYSVTIAQYLEITADGGQVFDHALFCRIASEVGRELELAITRIVEVDGTPRQIVDPAIRNDVELIDFRSEPDPAVAARTWMNHDYQAPMNLTEDRLMISALLRVTDDRSYWYVRSHHIAMDGSAGHNAVYEVFGRYNAAVRGEQYRGRPRADLAEIVADDAAYRQSARRQRDREHWLGRVVDLPERATLARHTAIAPLAPQNVVVATELDTAVRARIDSLATELGSSTAVLLTAAIAAYLGRMASTDDVVLTLPVTGRATAKVKNASGMLSNMLPIRAHDVSSLSFRDLVAQVQVELVGALRHQRYRFEDIRVDAGLTETTTASFGPIVNMMFFDTPFAVDDARITEYQVLSGGILEDLRINLYQASPDSGLVVDLHGNPHLYGESELQGHLDRLIVVLQRLVDRPERAVGDVSMLVPKERDWLTELGRGPRGPRPHGAHLLDGFLRSVAATPDAVALVYGDRSWTYNEFDALRRDFRAELHSRGVTVGSAVIVAVDRGPHQIAAIYAVLSLGGAYVPVDPAAPSERRALIARTVDATVIVDDELIDRVVSGPPAGSPETAELDRSALAGGGAHAAYVIFTSGSTGTPKGVQVSHDAVANRLAWMQDGYPIAADDVVLYKTPFTFDVSVWELLWPLQCGARMVIARPDGHRDPEYLFDLITTERVGIAHFVPSMLDVYTEVLHADGHRHLFGDSMRRIFTSGEALSKSLADRVLADATVDLVNLYGPTEAAVDVTEYVAQPSDDSVPIGRPVRNTDVYVLDSRLQLVPGGVAGELYLAGCQLADGYVGRNDLTADRFVADPFGTAGTRMYRTGDLVRWDAHGRLEYLGRTDFQVKIRGQRVEIGEVEAVLGALRGVDAVAVVAREDVGSGVSLVAYLRSDGGGVTERSALAWARRHLLSHMVPAAVVLLEEFPVNASGKLDRKSLPAPQTSAGTVYEPPESEIEVALATLVAELSGTERIGLRDNIFAAGLDSLSAARMVARARVEHGIGVDLTDVFGAADLGEIAAGAVRTGDQDGAAGPVRVSPRPQRIPLSAAQSRLWFINRMDPTSGTYNMPGAVRLGHDVDVPALRAALADILDRHEALRTRFPAEDGEPVQRVMPTADAVAQLDTDVTATDDLSARLADIGSVGFDLVAEIPFRAQILHDADGYVLLVVLHHIAGDGYSLEPLIRDLIIAYTRRRAGTEPDWAPLPIDYADFALWQRELLGDSDTPTEWTSRALGFWSAELDGLPDLLPIPTDRPRPPVAGGAGDQVDLGIDAALAGRIRQFARNHSVTPFTVLHTALSIVLARWTSTQDIAIGTAVAGRDDAALTDLVGMFVNTVVLRTAVTPDATAAELLAAAHQTRGRAMRNAAIPFERIVEALAPPRAASHAPLFQVALTMHPGQAVALDRWVPDAELIPVRVPTAKFDLALTATDRVETSGYDIEISYATELFDAATIVALGDRLIATIRAMLDAPHRPVGGIDLVPADEVAGLTAPAASAVPARTFPELLRAGAARALPSDLAIVGERDIAWENLESLTNQLARELIDRSAGPGAVVAISMPRSAMSVLATVAVIKTGAAFVSIDPAHPASRRAQILADSGAALGLTSGEADDVAPGAGISGATGAGTEWLLVDDPAFEIRLAGHSGEALRNDELTRPIDVDDEAYLIYTSGSTGTPKAASLSHRGLATMVANQRNLLALDTNSRILHVASPSFDASIFELTMALCAGACLVVSPAGVFGGSELGEIIARHGASHVVMTPSALGTVEPDRVPTLTHVISVGEACPPELVRRWDRPGVTFLNLYGPTETTIWATAAGPLHDGDAVTIGPPVAGVGALVLDGGLRPVSPGTPGELYLTGPQLARGYHGRRDLTATRFVANPYDDGDRMYRTGDRVVRDAAGALTYLGRVDHQVKIRGLRIEPGEVEGAFLTHPDVAEALTLAVAAPGGSDELVTYVRLATGARAASRDLLAHAADLLPGYLVPRAVTIVDSFRLTAAGKIDRKALPPVDFGDPDRYVAPRSQLESLVADAMGNVLKRDRVSAEADFFAIGGNSLSATKVTSQLGLLLDRQIPVKLLFDHPVVADLARSLIDQATTGGGALPLRPRPRAEMVPVSEMQRGLWLINRADPTSPAYNVALALRLTGRLDRGALKDAVADLVRRHEALRTTYPMVGGEPVQAILPESAVDPDQVLEIVETTDVPSAVAEVTGLGFDVGIETPVRARLLSSGPDEHILVFVVHHISADGSSMSVLGRDVVAAYAARSRGEAPRWTPLPIQYADYSTWQNERLAVEVDGRTERDRQLDYWADRLRGVPDRLDLPTDRPRPAVPTFAGIAHEFEISAELTDRLDALARETHTTLFMVTQAAFAVLLSRLGGTDDIVLGTPFAGRAEPGLDDVVGMFVNTLALRTRVASGEAFTDLLDRVRRDDLADMANHDAAFDAIVSRVLTKPPIAYNPIYQTMFTFQNLEFPQLRLGSLTVTPISEELSAAKVDLGLTLFPNDPSGQVSGGAMRAQLVYATDLFDAPTIHRMAQRYLRVLESVVAEPDIVVGDIGIRLDDETIAAWEAANDGAPDDDVPTVALPAAVEAASLASPTEIAVSFDGIDVTFADLGVMTMAMAAATPDADSALTMALMTVLPTLAAAGPDGLDTVLTDLTAAATRVATGVGSGSGTEGDEQA